MSEQIVPGGEQTPSIGDIHERHGLTTDDWQLVIDRLANARTHDTEAEPAVEAYASHVIGGDYPDQGFHHRDYLGRRHWAAIWLAMGTYWDHRFVPSIEIVRSGWFGRTMLRREIVPEQRHHIANYALLERYGTCTLADYARTRRDSWGAVTLPVAIDAEVEEGVNDIRQAKWDAERGLWVASRTITREQSTGWISDNDTWVPDTTNKTYEQELTEVDIAAILGSFCLSLEDTRDPAHVSPQSLLEAMFATALLKPEAVRERLLGIVATDVLLREPIKFDVKRYTPGAEVELQRIYQAHFDKTPVVRREAYKGRRGGRYWLEVDQPGQIPTLVERS